MARKAVQTGAIEMLFKSVEPDETLECGRLHLSDVLETQMVRDESHDLFHLVGVRKRRQISSAIRAPTSSARATDTARRTYGGVNVGGLPTSCSQARVGELPAASLSSINSVPTQTSPSG